MIKGFFLKEKKNKGQREIMKLKNYPFYLLFTFCYEHTSPITKYKATHDDKRDTALPFTLYLQCNHW